MSRYQKGKTNVDFTEARVAMASAGPYASLHLAPDIQITTPAPHRAVFTGRMPFLTPNQQRRSTEGLTRLMELHINSAQSFIIADREGDGGVTNCARRRVSSPPCSRPATPRLPGAVATPRVAATRNRSIITLIYFGRRNPANGSGDGTAARHDRHRQCR